MIKQEDYKKAFYYALALHFSIMLLLFIDTSSSKPALTMESKQSTQQVPAVAAAASQEPIKAVSIDNQELFKKVNQLKQERAQKQQAELNRKREMNQQLELAKQQRIKEQQRLAQLKEEANKIAIARKKQAEEEKKHLKELAEQKIQEAKKIEALKKQQELLKQQAAEEAKKQDELKQKAKIAAALQAKAEKLKAEQAQAKQRREQALAQQAEQARQAQLAQAALAQQNAAHQAQLAGEVDKYKALILNAIGNNWILPEQVDSSLSCQFQIRLAPDGTVLEVSLTRGSGDPLLDRSAQTAIRKASPLPVPRDPETFSMFRNISLTVRPEHVRG